MKLILLLITLTIANNSHKLTKLHLPHCTEAGLENLGFLGKAF